MALKHAHTNLRITSGYGDIQQQMELLRGRGRVKTACFTHTTNVKTDFATSATRMRKFAIFKIHFAG